MKKEKRVSFGVLDIFVILLAFVCAAGIVARYVLTSRNGVLAITPEKTYAAAQFLISGLEPTSQDAFSEGGTLTVGDGGESGEILPGAVITPAEYYAEDENGELYLAYEDDKDGKVDIRCTVVLGGWYAENGVFMLGGVTPLIPGETVTLSGGGVKASGLVIDVMPIDDRG